MEIIECFITNTNLEDIKNLGLFIAACIGIYLAIKRVNVAEKTQVTTSFTAAITQLGDKELSIRLGGIYALRKIAEDHPKSYKDVVGNTLQAFIRSTSKHQLTEKEILECGEDEGKLQEKEKQLNLFVPIKEDISAALASLVGIGIKRLSLPVCLLNGAKLEGGNLKKVDFRRAYLKMADLQGANLNGSYLHNAHLDGADLDGADFTGAKNLTIEQLSSAKSIVGIKLDPDLQEALDKELKKTKSQFKSIMS